MAILRQQQQFVSQLYSSGMVDDAEKSLILKPIEKRERQLVRRGPSWKAASLSDVRLPKDHSLLPASDIPTT